MHLNEIQIVIMVSTQRSSRNQHVNVARIYILNCGGASSSSCALADWLCTVMYQFFVCVYLYVFPEHSSRIWSCGVATVIRLATGQAEGNIPFPLHSSLVFHSHPSSPISSFLFSCSLQSPHLLTPFCSVHSLPVSSPPSPSPICSLYNHMDISSKTPLQGKVITW